MAVVASTTYLYVNSALIQHFIQGSELVDRGPWSSTDFYAVGDVVQIGVDQYIALAANSNTPPTGIVDDNWSSLVIVEQAGSVSSAGSDYYARYYAELALTTAWAGTALATTGTNIAWSAYYLAETGTNMVLAETGSRIAADNALIAFIFGSLAVDLTAETGSRIAADLTEQGTRSQEDQYLQNQIISETGSRVAADAALVSFVFGSIAVDLTAETGSRIAADNALTWSGTNESNSRAAGDQQIITIVETGTNTANSAWALAQLGTIIPPLSTLPDVNVPAPTANQVLSFDGSKWIAADAPTQIAPGAFTFYLDDSASGTLSYFNLLPSPSGGPEDSDIVAVGGSIAVAAFDTYISPFLERTVIPTGLWEFNTYAATDTAGQSFNVAIDVYTRSISGAETYLFSGTSALVTATAPQLVTSIVTTGSYITALTDKLVTKYYALRTGSPLINASLFHAGTAHASHLHTPIGFAHNDLGGLQGGAAEQFYHTTLDQHDALLGTSGYPSNSNRYVTAADLSYQIGTEAGTRSQEDQYLQNQIANLSGSTAGTFADFGSALAYEILSRQSGDSSIIYIASVGTNTGTSAYSYAAQAYNLAQTGTNLVIVESGTRGYRDQVLQTEIDTINYILGLNFQGTFSLYMANFRNGPPDNLITVINGAVTGWLPSYYIWEDFELYATGTLPTLNLGSAWAGAGTITTSLGLGIQAEDPMMYNAGSVVPNGSIVLNGGTGWTTFGTVTTPYVAIVGTDSMVYAAGTVYGTNVSHGTTYGSGYIDGGVGWSGTAIIYGYP